MLDCAFWKYTTMGITPHVGFEELDQGHTTMGIAPIVPLDLSCVPFLRFAMCHLTNGIFMHSCHTSRSSLTLGSHMLW